MVSEVRVLPGFRPRHWMLWADGKRGLGLSTGPLFLRMLKKRKFVEKRTYNDRRQYLIDAVAKRRRKIRLKAIAFLGGKCAKCGYSKCPEVLEFHYKDPSKKDFNVSRKGHCRSWERVKEEIKKCVLLCANCHREVHVELNKLKHKG